MPAGLHMFNILHPNSLKHGKTSGETDLNLTSLKVMKILEDGWKWMVKSYENGWKRMEIGWTWMEIGWKLMKMMEMDGSGESEFECKCQQELSNRYFVKMIDHWLNFMFKTNHVSQHSEPFLKKCWE